MRKKKSIVHKKRGWWEDKRVLCVVHFLIGGVVWRRRKRNGNKGSDVWVVGGEKKEGDKALRKKTWHTSLNVKWRDTIRNKERKVYSERSGLSVKKKEDGVNFFLF